MISELRIRSDLCRPENHDCPAVRLDRKDWKRHYGPQFKRLIAAKRRYDPDNIFTSGPDMFAGHHGAATSLEKVMIY